MLRETRRLDAPELDAWHHALELRTTGMRFGVHRGRRMSSDWGVAERGSPFVHRMSRPCLSVLLEGAGRFDEHGRRWRLAPGDLVLSNQRDAGTEAYAGESVRTLFMDWDPSLVGAAFAGGMQVLRLGAADRARLSLATDALTGSREAEAAAEIVRVLRSVGMRFEPVAADDLDRPVPELEQRLATALSAGLSSLRTFPAIDDVAGELGWNARLVHRRIAAIARRYAVPWDNWRTTLHHIRLMSALRLLSVPGATTELVARLTGFRSPTALCHTFADAGLPSPGTFARAARLDVLEGWADHAAPTTRAA